jgi:tetratricopeptide (TPR) repeat protein
VFDGGSRVRITARLTDTHSGQEIWSERYDRELNDVLALQDEVVGGGVAELRRALGADIEHAPRERPVSPEVWELLVQGRAQIEEKTPVSALRARELLSRCVELDPEFALGWVELANSELELHLFAVESDDAYMYLVHAFEHVRHALALDPEQPVAHATLGILLSLRGEVAAAVDAVQRAIALAPGDANLRVKYGILLNFAGRSEEAIPVLKNLTRLDPAQRYMHLFQLAVGYRRLGRIDEAIAKHRESVQANPDFLGSHTNLAAIYAELGEMNQARASLAEVMRLRPDFSVARIPRLPSGREFLVENLRKAGLEE